MITTVQHSADEAIVIALGLQHAHRAPRGEKCGAHVAMPPYASGLYIYYPQGNLWLCDEGQKWDHLDPKFRSPCVCRDADSMPSLASTAGTDTKSTIANFFEYLMFPVAMFVAWVAHALFAGGATMAAILL